MSQGVAGGTPRPARLLAEAAALQRRGGFGEAAARYEAILRAVPDQVEALGNLGLCRLQLGAAEEAVALLRRTLALHPHSVETLNNLGGALQALNRQEEAIAPYRRALALDPRFADGHNNLGTALKTLGDLDEATRCFRAAIALDPERPAFIRNLVDAETIRPGDPILATLLGMADRAATLAREPRQQMHFALAKALSDIGEPARGFDHLLTGNRLKREDIRYDERNTLAMFDRIRATFSADLLGRAAGSGSPSPLPVFVVGMPRSGTTLVEQILASHPLVAGAGERSDIEACARSLGSPQAPFPEAVVTADPTTFRELGDSQADRLRRLAPYAERVVDKMPANLSLLGLIHLMLPGARIIHVERNPVDTCLSCFATLFMGHQPFAYDLAELGRYHAASTRLMAHWHAVLPRASLLTIRYEDLVGDIEREARRMVAHCGLDWDAACLRFHETRRPVRTASATQVRRPIYRTSLRRWRPEGAPWETLSAALQTG